MDSLVLMASGARGKMASPPSKPPPPLPNKPPPPPRPSTRPLRPFLTLVPPSAPLPVRMENLYHQQTVQLLEQQKHELQQMETLTHQQQLEQQRQFERQQQQQIQLVTSEYQKTSAAQLLWIKFGFGALCCACCPDAALECCY